MAIDSVMRRDSGNPVRILVLEPYEAAIRIIVERFSPAEIRIARTTEAAFALARQFPFDAGILECRVRDGTPLSLIRAIRKGKTAIPTSAHLLCVTTDPITFPSEKLLNSGADDVLVKPIAKTAYEEARKKLYQAVSQTF